MKIFNLRNTTIQWRIFDWNDSTALNHGVFRTDKKKGETASLSFFEYDDPAGKFLLEVRDKGAPDPFYWPSLHFNHEQQSVVDGNGAVRVLQQKRLVIEHPVKDAVLTETRLGLGTDDWVRVVLHMEDEGGLQGKSDNAEIEILVQQTGWPDRVVTLRGDLMEDGWPEKLVFPKTQLDLRHSGPTWLTARQKHFQVSSLAVPITVAPTEPRIYRLALNGQQGPDLTIDAPRAGDLLHVELWGDSPGIYRDVRVKTSLDGFSSTTNASFVRLENSGGRSVPKFEARIPIAQDQEPLSHRIEIQDRDYFGVEAGPSAHDFRMTDTTPPVIEVLEPADGQQFVAPEGLATGTPVRILVRGTVRDSQSGFKVGTLTYTAAGQSNIPVAVTSVVRAGGDWQFELAVNALGSYDIALSASDMSGNVGNSAARNRVRFEVIRAFRPQNVDELLSETAYLRELQRFVRDHLTRQAGGSPAAVSAPDLLAAFGQPLGDIGESDPLSASQPVSDLLAPIRLLNDIDALDPVNPDSLADSTGLIARWNFAELERGATDGMPDVAGRHGIRGQYMGPGNYATNIRSLGGAGTSLEGQGALVFQDSQHRAVIEVNATGRRAALELGRGNRDFSVSFWIHPLAGPNGNWRQVIYKGNDAGGRTACGVWLMPNSNALLFRVAPLGSLRVDCASKAVLAQGRWSHVVCIKTVSTLQIWVNGHLDQEVHLRTTLGGPTVPVEATPGDLHLGTSPNQPGFIGGLSDLRIYGFPLEPESIADLAIERRTEAPPVAALREYCINVYEAMLHGLGTSVEELRQLRTLSPARRQELAARLGLDAQAGNEPDRLGTLSMPESLPDASLADWLSGQLGFPHVRSASNVRGTSELLRVRREVLSLRWSAEDAVRSGIPELDPDLVDLADIDPAATGWTGLYRTRQAALDLQWTHFRNALLPAGQGASPISAVVAEVVTRDEQSKLHDLEAADRAGRAIGEELQRFGLEMTSFRRLVAYLNLESQGIRLSQSEGDDLAHLLTQLWKVRQRHPSWVQEESAVSGRLWPTASAAAAWREGGYKESFLPWRGNASLRSRQEARLAGRVRAWQGLQAELDLAIAEAQKTVLPRLRDRLLGIHDLPKTQRFLNELAERWLVDFGAAGMAVTTPVQQAIASLQTLVNGISGGWFERQHPAVMWSAGVDAARQWQGIDTLARWRTSVLNFLYPENSLYPELRKTNSAELKTLIDELGKMQPVSEAAISNPATPVGQAWAAVFGAGGSEAQFFGPLAIGLTLQRAGRYADALTWYGRFYDRTQSLDYRRRYAPLSDEPYRQPPRVSFSSPTWAADLGNIHEVARHSGCRNPYTRFVVYQILQCLLARADDAFTAGSPDDRARALGLYLEASDVLEFEELQDPLPADANASAYLPSPVLSSLRMHVDAALRKLRRGLNFLGMPVVRDDANGAGIVLSSLARPTPYRYKLLIERAKQLVAQSQQIESQYFAALEGADRKTEQLMNASFQLESAGQTVTLRQIQKSEADHGRSLAVRQQERSGIQVEQYRNWIARGNNEHERAQLESIQTARDARQVANVADSILGAAQAAQTAAGLIELVTSGGAKAAIAATMATAVVARGVAQGIAIDQETAAQLSSIYASQERREDEWRLQRDLAEQDLAIGAAQITMAEDRIQIATQELVMASTQRSQAQQMLVFLQNQDTSAFFFQWLKGELRRIYATFLRMATATAQSAELQVAFERQERPAGLIRADYWQLSEDSAAAVNAPSGSSGTAPAVKSNGITGSARLLQDIYLLDERVFHSERRLLNLTQSFSLARLMPVEFEEFRRTGQLSFATPMRWFDEGFPGHYMRMIKKVRVAVAALVPPGQGIRATLVNNGVSRVVTADAGFPTVALRQPPQLVALTSPVSSSGVFELDVQGELLYPFEGTGVDTSWSLELPPAGNPFDFESLMDVLISIDYTAQFSTELRERVVKSLPRRIVSDRAFSVRRDLPDVWYDLANGQQAQIPLRLSAAQFPPGLSELRIQDLALSVRTTAGEECAYQAELQVNSSTGVGPVTAVRGVASSRQSGARAWQSALAALPNVGREGQTWTWRISDAPAGGVAGPPPILQQLRDGVVDDILIVMTFSGLRPAW